MKTLDIALKDLRRSIRGATFLAFGFVVPLLMSGLFYFAFGAIGSGDQGLNVPVTKVQVVNLDQGAAEAGGFAAGQALVDLLQSKDLASLLQVSQAAGAEAARAAVDRQEAGVAVIVPAGFSAAAFSPQGKASIELYSDPTLSLGPAIVQGIVRQYVDTFVGFRIAVAVAAQQLGPRGVTVDAGMAQALALQYAGWATALNQGRSQGTDVLLEVRPPAGSGEQPANLTTVIVSLIMSGMLVFYVFFTGAASAQSLLQEQEAGTLARVFTTPTRPSAVLGGRILATYLLLAVQITVLLVLSALIFRIQWGQPAGIACVALGLVVLSASFGLFITSLLKNSKQGGFIYGGVMTIMGMLGMMSVFAPGAAASSRGALDTVALFVPQGWAVRGWQMLQKGAGLAEVLPTVAVMLALGALFFLIGLSRFSRRFAKEV